MAVKEPTPKKKENTELLTSRNSEIISQDVKPVEVPEGITEEEAQDLRERATSLINQLEEAKGSHALALIDRITAIGIQSQRRAGAELDLLKTRMADLLTQNGSGAEISKDLVELRLVLNEINPHELSKPGFLRRLFGFLPFVGKLPSLLRILEKIAIRYETVSRQVQIVETKLRDGRSMLRRDNIELRKLYEQVEDQQLPIRKSAYMGLLIMQQLSRLLTNINDPLEEERIRNALHDVSMRIQDLRTMDEVHTQFFVSIEMTRQNNNRLAQSVDRTLSLAANMVMVGLAIQTALARQKKILEATQRTQEFLGDMILANAAAIKRHTEEIGDVYNNPVVAVEKITQAHNDLIEAMEIANQLKKQGIEFARENIAKLSQLTTDLQLRSQGLVEQGEAGTPVIE
ncbi:MAG: toxic anion resistance protein [Anaerolineaceae bacterium]|nr:MAG: toxic anion resistance protein [Anaerolineaceae bacterium]